jgi:POT family proton-dependent oligopeptide transporter
MLIAIAIYTLGARYLPPDQQSKNIVPDRSSRGQGDLAGARFMLLVGVMLAVVIFRGAYEQTGNSIALWTDQGIDRSLGAHVIPMTWFQAINPLLIILLTPVYVTVWTRLARRDREPSSIKKMAMGAVIVGFSYVITALAARFSAEEHLRTSWVWLAVYFITLTVGELLILPVGLGMFGRLAPKGFEATAIATWFFAAFAGNLLAGAVGALWSVLSSADFFAIVAVISFASAVLLTPFFRRSERAEAALRSGDTELLMHSVNTGRTYPL